MCGIAGFVGALANAPSGGQRIRAMCDAIAHRGPDSDGFFQAPGVALGMRRLSVIDVAGGRQPISNEDGTVTVVFNGEIYNHHALRDDLEAAGHVFRTKSDTEVLVHLYEQHGAEMTSRLHGMFAFSIWDSKAETLFIARDRSGMKPLSYREFANGLAFGSELRSLWVFDSEALRVSPAAVMEYLAFGYVPEPGSIFEGVQKLPPGHSLTWSAARGLRVKQYWTPPVSKHSKLSDDDKIAFLREALEKSVASHLESDVPLGAFLSSGIDSSTVVSLMSRHASGRVRTFSIGFSEVGYDESVAAREVAAEFGTEHTELIVDPAVGDIFEGIAQMFDEPFADSSAIPTFLVAQLARQSVTVALSGDGGDELFGGYTRYLDTLRAGVSDPGRVGRLLGALGVLLPHFVPGRNRLINGGRSKLGKYASRVVQAVRPDEGGVALANTMESQRRIGDQLDRYLPAEMRSDFAAAMMRVDFHTYLPGDILTKVDRTSMAVSLEARVPFLDCDLVDFALSLPGPDRVTVSETKRLLRRAVAELVPASVLSRPKRGFEIPLGRWLRGPLCHRVEALASSLGTLAPYVSHQSVRRIVREHLIGRRDHSVMLWRLMVLQYWLDGLKQGQLGRPPEVPRFA